MYYFMIPKLFMLNNSIFSKPKTTGSMPFCAVNDFLSCKTTVMNQSVYDSFSIGLYMDQRDRNIVSVRYQMRNRQTILHSGRISCDHPFRISVLARPLNSNEDHSYLHGQYSDTRDLENCLSSTFLQQFGELDGPFQFQHDNGSHSQITVD